MNRPLPVKRVKGRLETLILRDRAGFPEIIKAGQGPAAKGGAKDKR